VSDEQARLFVALDVPEEVRVELARWAREAVGGAPGVRVLEPGTLHVTLCFLGWRPLAQAPRMGELVLGCAAAGPPLEVADAAWLPARRPGVLALDLTDPTRSLGALQACVVKALVEGVGYEPEQRAFRPHLTVARLRRGSRKPNDPLPPAPALAFAGEALTLYRSHLTREGARYEALATAPG
jgi:RNA 2',3'-cyclic 3'-phosphodiesterase